MQGHLRKLLPQRLAVSNLEHEIQTMEADLEYHRKQVRVFEETLMEQQHMLSKLRRGHEKYMGGIRDE